MAAASNMAAAWHGVYQHQNGIVAWRNETMAAKSMAAWWHRISINARRQAGGGMARKAIMAQRQRIEQYIKRKRNLCERNQWPSSIAAIVMAAAASAYQRQHGEKQRRKAA